MISHEKVAVSLQSGKSIYVHCWPCGNYAQPMVIIAPESSPSDWNVFASLISPSHSVVLTDVSTSFELLMLIWEIGEPALVIAQGNKAVKVAKELVSIAPGSANAIVLCDGVIPAKELPITYEISTLILRGRQSTSLSHADAVDMHVSLRLSTLVEPENCGDFPAKHNAAAAASAVNWFIKGVNEIYENTSDNIVIDPWA